MSARDRMSFTLLICCPALLLICTTNGAQSQQKLLASINLEWGVNLYMELINYGIDNIVISPFDILTSLHLVYDAANGTSKSQLRKFLKLSLEENDSDALRALLSDTRASVLSTANKTGSLHEAIALFVQKDEHYMDAFVNKAARHYGAHVKQIDFKEGTRAVTNAVNNWVEEKTGIEHFLASDTLLSSKPILLVDAVRFRSNFAKSIHVGDLPFYVYPDLVTTVKTMHGIGEYNYGYDSDFRVSVLEVPLTDEGISMYLLLHDADSQLEPATERKISLLLPDLKPTRVNVSIPELIATQNIGLKEILEQWSVTDLFNPRRGMLPGLNSRLNMHITQFFHQSAVEIVNDAPSDNVYYTQYNDSVSMPITQFIANRPFVFMIRDNSNGIVLFLGRISHPTKQMEKPSIRELVSGTDLCRSSYSYAVAIIVATLLLALRV